MVGADGAPYGFVVESVNVSVLLYVPVRGASPALAEAPTGASSRQFLRFRSCATLPPFA